MIACGCFWSSFGIELLLRAKRRQCHGGIAMNDQASAIERTQAGA
jgi:hypothetical protein